MQQIFFIFKFLEYIQEKNLDSDWRYSSVNLSFFHIGWEKINWYKAIYNLSFVHHQNDDKNKTRYSDYLTVSVYSVSFIFFCIFKKYLSRFQLFLLIAIFIFWLEQTKCGIIYEKIALGAGDFEWMINYEWHNLTKHLTFSIKSTNPK